MKSKFILRGFVIAELYGADGRLKWRDAGSNIIVDEGIEFIMDTALSAGTQDTTYFVGLKDTGTVAAGDTAAQIGGSNGWAEITAIYSGNRPAWTEAGVTSKVITNAASAASFAITGTDDVYGAFLSTDASSTTGSLIGARDFTTGSPVSVVNTDTLNITYQITGSTS